MNQIACSTGPLHNQHSGQCGQLQPWDPDLPWKEACVRNIRVMVNAGTKITTQTAWPTRGSWRSWWMKMPCCWRTTPPATSRPGWTGKNSCSLNSERLAVKFVLFLSLNYVWAFLSHFWAPRKSFIHFTMQWWLRNWIYALSLDLAKIPAALDPNCNINVFSVAAKLGMRRE